MADLTLTRPQEPINLTVTTISGPNPNDSSATACSRPPYSLYRWPDAAEKQPQCACLSVIHCAGHSHTLPNVRADSWVETFRAAEDGKLWAVVLRGFVEMSVFRRS